MNLRTARAARRATVAPLAAILAIPMLGMLAFSVDMSYIVLVRTELQSAADAGALAGAQSLQDGYINYNQTNNAISTYTAAATTAVRNIIQANAAGGQALAFASGTDIEFGTTSSAGVYSSTVTGYPNSVKVWARRDSTSNSAIRPFFAPVIGTNTVNITAVAAATLQTGTIAPSTQDIPGITGADDAGILPLTYNVNWWDDFLRTGNNPDGTDASTSNGIPYLTAFGGGGSSNQNGQANWGWLSLNNSHNGSNELSGWVNNGMSNGDFADLQNDNLLPLSLHDPNQLPTSDNGPSGSYNWLGDNGAKVSVAHTINNYIGKTFLIPLFQPVPTGQSLPNGVQAGDAGIGHSNQFYYNIVRFVSVKIVDGGNNNQVAIAPSSSFPPQTNFTNTQIADTSGARSASTNPTVFAYAKLTQ